MEENAKSQDGGDKTLSISILKLNKQHVLLYFSTYQLHLNILRNVKKIFCFVNKLFTFSIHLPALSPLFI